MYSGSLSLEKISQTEKKYIPENIAVKLCNSVDRHSSYVQQLSWNLFVLTDKVASESNLEEAISDMLRQNNSFFTEQIKDLTSYQLNFLKAVARRHYLRIVNEGIARFTRTSD